jgi:hypothetical protein
MNNQLLENDASMAEIADLICRDQLDSLTPTTLHVATSGTRLTTTQLAFVDKLLWAGDETKEVKRRQCI